MMAEFGVESGLWAGPACVFKHFHGPFEGPTRIGFAWDQIRAGSGSRWIRVPTGSKVPRMSMMCLSEPYGGNTDEAAILRLPVTPSILVYIS